MINLKEKLEHQKIAIIIGSVVLALLILAGSCAGYAYVYQNKFYPGVSVGTILIGGQFEEDGRATINERVDTLFLEGAIVNVNGTTKTIPLRVEAQGDPDLARDLVILNVDDALTEAYSIGRRGPFLQRVYEVAHALVARPNIAIEVSTDQEVIAAQLLENFSEYYDPAQEPTFNIELVDKEWEVTVIDGHSGRAFDLEGASNRLIESLTNLSMKPLHIKVVDQEPALTTRDAESMIDNVYLALNNAPYNLTYDGGRFDQHEFELTAEEIAPMIKVEQFGKNIVLSMNDNANVLIDELKAELDTESLDAKFEMDGNRVKEFQPSREGRSVNKEYTLKNLVTAMASVENVDKEALDITENNVEIMIDIIEPDIPTGSVNDFGITEILGVGTSNFSGSPYNRIQNIKHGMSKLNGVLIAPGEEYSLIKQLKPFTIADGYLPELVIKGDEIKPEIGGGLCQIGSTTFRALMNSGLKITERRNHSLVVSYYNDASNGNPGTDATLYDPAPDLKFINDTAHHILLTTDMNEETKILSFTFWGTNDGRKGYYTPPVVHNWIGAGAKKTTYTTELAPGRHKCQGAHPGANTSFSYIVERPGQEPEETVYESHYRPLPTICLVGLEDGQSVGENGELIEAPETETEEVTDNTDSDAI